MAVCRELFVTRIESRPSARSGPVTTLNRPWEIVFFVDLDRPDPQRDAEAVEVRRRPGPQAPVSGSRGLTCSPRGLHALRCCLDVSSVPWPTCASLVIPSSTWARTRALCCPASPSPRRWRRRPRTFPERAPLLAARRQHV